MSRIGMMNKISVNLHPSDLAKGMQYWGNYINYDKKKILFDTLIEGDNIDQNIISKLSEKDIKRLLSMDNDDMK